MSKGTDNFKRAIQEHLNYRGFTDPLFAETLKKPNKNIDDCITYILNTVKSSKCNGFEEKEIFNMAVHYYDEDNVKPGAKINASRVVVNHQIKLTDEEIEDARKKAREEIIAEEKAKMRKKPKVVKVDKPTEEQTLF